MPLIVVKVEETHYPASLVVLVGKAEEADRWLKRRFGWKKGVEAAQNAAGRYLMFHPPEGSDAQITSVIWMPVFKLTIEYLGYIGHEILHHVQAVMELIGHRVTTVDEPSSYYFTFLLHRAVEGLKDGMERRKRKKGRKRCRTRKTTKTI